MKKTVFKDLSREEEHELVEAQIREYINVLVAFAQQKGFDTFVISVSNDRESIGTVEGKTSELALIILDLTHNIQNRNK